MSSSTKCEECGNTGLRWVGNRQELCNCRAGRARARTVEDFD